MDFRDKDGGPLITWHDPQSAFEAWKRCSAGRPCDYTGLTYDRLRGGSGTMIKAAAYLPPHEMPAERYPFQLTTGRTLYHFHTRTKTARAPQLNAAAPDVWVEACASDAAALGLGEGDLVEVSTPRGALRGLLRVTDIRPGLLFVPFHYGYWDTESGHGPDGDIPARAANETTVTDWDPVSKQPLFKTAAAALRLVERGNGRSAPAPTTTASAPSRADAAPATTGGTSALATQASDTGRKEGTE
jgi:predicted molibdopterin-dependent oxidoreductase YjgC